MDKRDQMENSFFDPERPGSIFIAIDRYHHYTPLPGNSLRFVEGNQREVTDAAFYKFLSDNVNEVKSCTYVPDVEMVRYDLNWMRDVPSQDTHMPLDKYIRQELLPYLQRSFQYPSRQISLSDAVYCSRYKGDTDCSILKKYFVQEADYMSFRRSQDERQKIYRGEANFRTPLKVVENDFGYLIFSGNEIGKEGFRECLQHIIDHYFDPHYDIGHLGVYEYPYVTEELAAHIDASYRIDHARQLNNSFEFQRENHVPQSKLPDKFINGLTPLFYSPMETTADGFMELADKFHFDPDVRAQIIPSNRDIYRLLTVMKNGYMNIHEQPFTYFKELLPVARKLERITQVRSAADFDRKEFKQASMEIREAADSILKRDFDVRGHRSLKNMLDDPMVEFTVGNRRLNDVQKSVLSSGYALYIPENNREAVRHLQYCMADFGRNRMKNSSEPFPVKTYTLKEGLLHPLPTNINKKPRAVKKPENQKRKTNRLK